MSFNYFLLPSDIKLVDKNDLNNDKINLKYNEELRFSLIKLYKVNFKNEIELLETINLLDKKLKDLILRYPKLDARLDNICSPNNNKSSLLKGKKPKIMGILNITKDSFYDGGKFFNLQQKL